MLNSNKSQTQSVESDGVAQQAGRDLTIHNHGLSYTEAKEVALDVFRANFVQLVGEAREAARVRAEEITERFLKKLQAENPAGLNKANDPDFQYSLYNVQREYARTADNDLGNLLVDLLVDRTKQNQRDMLQIVLNESILVAPKITDQQLAVLSVLFFFLHASMPHVGNHEQFGIQLDRFVKPFVGNLPKGEAAYQHLQFAGCGSLQSMVANSLVAIIKEKYQGLFMSGFDSSEISSCSFAYQQGQRFTTACINNSFRIQTIGLNQTDFDSYMSGAAISDSDKATLKNLFSKNVMSDQELQAKCISIRSYMSELFDAWQKSGLQRFFLTSVGIALGHANIKRMTGEFADLRVWIN